MLDGAPTTSAPSTPAASPAAGVPSPSSAPAPSSASAPASTPAEKPKGPKMTARRSPRERGDDGKFLSAAKKEAFLARQAASEDQPAALPKPGIIKATDKAADDDAEAPAIEAAEPQEEAPAAEANDSPESWPAPAQKAIAEHKAAYQAVLQQNDAIRKEATLLMKQAAQHERRAKWLEGAIAAAGFEIDPTMAKLFEYETRDALEVDVQQQTKQQQEQHVQALAQQHLAQVKSQAAQAAQRHGLDAEDILWAYATAGQRWEAKGRKGPEPTIADAVQERLELAAARQAKANSTAPALVQAPKTSTPKVAARKFENNTEGRKAFLRSQGYDLT